ncbi:MAG TPA: GNAT family N-acetyltransferase [Burkholderiales bacterium]|nr:GNAT family N-acetyltransferase [Burkholderiales bacterium]
MSAVSIRKMRREDLPRAMEILARWNMAPQAPSTERPHPERSSLLVENSFVALADQRLVGVASYILHGNGLAETASLAVDPGWRGAGVGALLQRARLAEMHSRGVRKVRTEADRPDAIAWYVHKFGYRITGTVRKKHPFSLEDVGEWTVLELDLPVPLP